MRVLFSRNFAYAKFLENKILSKCEFTLSITDIGKSCPSRKFLTSQVYLNAVRENKILAKISGFTVSVLTLLSEQL